MTLSKNSRTHSLIDVLLGVSIAFVLNLFVWTALDYSAPGIAPQSQFLMFILLGLVALVVGAYPKLSATLGMPVRLGLMIGGLFIIFVSYMRWGYEMQEKMVLLALAIALAVLIWLGNGAKR